MSILNTKTIILLAVIFIIGILSFFIYNGISNNNKELHKLRQQAEINKVRVNDSNELNSYKVKTIKGKLDETIYDVNCTVNGCWL